MSDKSGDSIDDRKDSTWDEAPVTVNTVLGNIGVVNNAKGGRLSHWMGHL